jgi:hypothetical protein
MVDPLLKVLTADIHDADVTRDERRLPGFPGLDDRVSRRTEGDSQGNEVSASRTLNDVL